MLKWRSRAASWGVSMTKIRADSMHVANLLDAEQDEYTRMQYFILLYDLPAEIRHDLLEAYDTKTDWWDWTKCDGCTAVHEAHSPRGMKFPPCVRHDFDCERAEQAKTHKEAMQIRWEGDNRFYRIMKAFRTGWFHAARRWLGVRTYWTLWGRWWWKSACI